MHHYPNPMDLFREISGAYEHGVDRLADVQGGKDQGKRQRKGTEHLDNHAPRLNPCGCRGDLCSDQREIVTTVG